MLLPNAGETNAHTLDCQQLRHTEEPQWHTHVVWLHLREAVFISVAPTSITFVTSNVIRIMWQFREYTFFFLPGYMRIALLPCPKLYEV